MLREGRVFLVQALNAMVLQNKSQDPFKCFQGVLSWDIRTSNTYFQDSEPGQAAFFFFFFLMFPCLSLIYMESKLVRVMIFKLNSNKSNVGYQVTCFRQFQVINCYSSAIHSFSCVIHNEKGIYLVFHSMVIYQQQVVPQQYSVPGRGVSFDPQSVSPH